MTTQTQAVERAAFQPFVVMDALSTQDQAYLVALARVAEMASPALLQGALDHATDRPRYTYQLLHDAELGYGLLPLERRALEAARAAVQSNVFQHLQLTPTASGELEKDELYVRRRRIYWNTSDRDAFRRMGSAMLYGVARLAAGKEVRRRVRPGVQ